jgi:hypothetical protein
LVFVMGFFLFDVCFCFYHFFIPRGARRRAPRGARSRSRSAPSALSPQSPCLMQEARSKKQEARSRKLGARCPCVGVQVVQSTNKPQTAHGSCSAAHPIRPPARGSREACTQPQPPRLKWRANSPTAPAVPWLCSGGARGGGGSCPEVQPQARVKARCTPGRHCLQGLRWQPAHGEPARRMPHHGRQPGSGAQRLRSRRK